MQPILLLGIVAAVAITMSSGFLLTDSITVWLQAIGTGAANVEDPVNHVSVDIDIDKVLNNAGTAETTSDDFWDNVVTECSIHIDRLDDQGATNLQDQDNDAGVDGINEVICKITESGVVKGEGSITFANGGEYDPAESDADCAAKANVGGNQFFCTSKQYIIAPLEWADGSPATISEFTDVRVVVRGENPTTGQP